MSVTETRLVRESAPNVYHRWTEIGGHRLFYREAGDISAPSVVLLHGAPASSHMYRTLIPLLAAKYHVVAPDYLGFGNSDSPTVTDFDYTFDSITNLTSRLLDEIGVTEFAMYVQDYGAPVGWRLALARPEAVTAIISQNGNAYEDGFGAIFWDDLWKYSASPNDETEAPLRSALTEASIRDQYVTGTRDIELVSPDAWQNDYANLQRPGNRDVALALFRNYVTNRVLYPAVHEYFRTTQVPALIVWGENDPIFVPAGARAFLEDLPDAELHLVDAGHFALESDLAQIAPLILDFLERTLKDTP
ncbi:alpha/beta hydrolase [Subtercola boreus]|uniref:Alpha/beta hydrolase n=1 Tax=Subtercola boreus TaxID=120213 RepID=A0A3E0VUN8_9MICO|nr:alpha/beta hydrolase [Subtercola boreus]RFA13108.1 alpha/beta hydrolase [Subtercola boreus]